MSFWDSLVQRLQTLGENVIEWVILIVVALAILLVGRWIIGLIRVWVEKLLSARALDPVWRRSGIAKALEGGEQTPASLVARLIHGYLFLVLLLIVAQVLQLTAIEGLLVRLLAWIPLLLLAALIIIASAAVASWTANLVRPFAERRGVGWLATLVHIGVVVFGVLFAMDMLDIEFAEDIVKIVVAAVAIAGAIAFGVGGIDTAKRWWARYGTPEQNTPPPTV